MNHYMMWSSLVPRLFPLPVLIAYSMPANVEGESLGDLVMCGYVR